MISKKTKYGLKALGYLANQQSDDPIQISAIAQSENISQKFLESILLSLKKAGILGSKKGKGGGYYMLKNPKEVYMTDVYRLLEGPIALVPCVSLNFYEKCRDCKSEDACYVNHLMKEIRDTTLHTLKHKTLEDFILKR